MPRRKKIVELPPIAEPNIDQVFTEFLEEQGRRLRPKSFAEYEAVIGLLRGYLDGYGYEGLSDAEAALLEKYAAEPDGREFCELFGPDHVIENLGMFLDYFMVRKVMASETLSRAAGRVTKKLCKWLAARGCVSEEEAAEGASTGAEAAEDLPQARRAAKIISESAPGLGMDPPDLPDEDYLDFDHYTITKLAPGKIWFADPEGGRQHPIGPVPVPAAATELLRLGWSISCAMGRTGGTWRILSAANVYTS